MLFDLTTEKQQLTLNDVHLWTITPKKISSPAQLLFLKSLLSENELKKCQNYRQPEAQHTALITRAFIRTVLALYIDKKPQELEFIINQHGKPELCNIELPLRFNLSHNDQLIVCSVCLEDDIGCDVENLSRKINIDSIAKRYFSTQESQTLLLMPTAIKQMRFFEYWTLKEAFVKAMGIGISFGLGTFSFAISESQNTKFNDGIVLEIADHNSKIDPNAWYHCLIYPDDNHCIAISIKRKKKNGTIMIKQFNGDNFI